MVRVRGSAKVMAHLMFRILKLPANNMIKIVISTKVKVVPKSLEVNIIVHYKFSGGKGEVCPKKG